MKKGLLLTICLGVFLALASPCYAIPLIWDVGTAGAPANGDADTLTGLFNQVGFSSQTSTIQYDTDGILGLSAGDRFVDAGNLRVTDLISSGFIDKEGLWTSGGYEVTAIWDDVTGYVSGISGGLTNTRLDLFYDGGTVNFYLDTSLDSAFADPAGSDPDSGAGGTGFGNGTLIATMTLLRGIGHTFIDFAGGDLANQGSVEFELQFTYMLPGFWLNAAEIDLLDLNPVLWHFMTTDMNIDTPVQNPGVPQGALYTAYSNQNGSAEMAVVPEPSTIILLGGGLIGLACVGRRRARKD